MNKEKVLTGKDLINIGIYTIIWFVLSFIAMFMGIVPLLWMLLPGLVGIFTAIPFAMMNLKVKKPLAIIIMGAVAGLLYFVTGQFTGLLILTFSIACIASELVRFLFHYNDTFISMTISFICFCYGMAGSPLPIWVYGDSFFAQIEQKGMTPDFIAALRSFTAPWAMILMLISPIIGGTIGMLIAKLLFKKHFVKAGMV